MAQNWNAGKQAERDEQEKIKNLTLNIAVRMEEEENMGENFLQGK